MYYLVESDRINRSGDEKSDSVVKLLSDEEVEQLNVNLPDESEITDEEVPTEETPEEDTENTEEVAPTESKKYDLPKISHAKFEKVSAEHSPYDSLPGADYVILAHNITEGIEAVIHGSGYGIVVTTRNNVEFCKNYLEAKKYVIRTILDQHNKYLQELNEGNYDKNLREIYEACNDLDGNIKMLLKENSLKVIYPRKRKSITITRDTNNYQYVIETRVGKDISTNTVSDSGIVMHSRDIIKSIIMGG